MESFVATFFSDGDGVEVRNISAKADLRHVASLCDTVYWSFTCCSSCILLLLDGYFLSTFVH